MPKPHPAGGGILIVAPTLQRARSAAKALDRRWSRHLPEAATLDDLGPNPDRRIVLCPTGVSVARDLAFLRRAKERLSWPAADADICAAVAGLRGEHRETTAGKAAPERPTRAARKSGLLIEGIVTGRRARAALSSGARRWIVESALAVRLSVRELAQLAGKGVRWSVLEPICVVAVIASASLVRDRRAWRRLVPRGAKVLVWGTRG